MTYLNKKNYILMIVAILISFFTIFALIKMTSDNSLIYLNRLKSSFIIIILLLIFLSLLIDTIRIYDLMKAMGENLSFSYLFKFNLSMFFITDITPFGSGSLPLAIYLFNKKKIAVNRGLLIFTAKLLFSGIFFGTIPPFLLIFFRKQMDLDLFTFYFAILASVIATFLMVLMLYIILKPKLVISVIKWIEGFKIVKKHNWEKYTQTAINETLEYNKRFKELFMARDSAKLLFRQMFYAILFWVLFYSIAPVIMIALKIHFSWIAVYSRQFIFYDILSYNIIPSGAGIMEIGFATIFAKIVPHALLGIFIGIWRFFTYHAYLLISAVGFYLCIREVRLDSVTHTDFKKA